MLSYISKKRPVHAELYEKHQKIHLENLVSCKKANTENDTYNDFYKSQ